MILFFVGRIHGKSSIQNINTFKNTMCIYVRFSMVLELDSLDHGWTFWRSKN